MAALARRDSNAPELLGWPHVVVPRANDRRLARAVVKTFGMVLGASTGMFLGGIIGIVFAMFLLPLFADFALGLLLTVTLASTSMGAVVGSRVLEREAFDE
jgi:hypothetical protein